MKRQKHVIVAFLVAMSLAVLGLTITPAAGHVAGWAHNWNKHIKPRADNRYYTKAKTDARYYTKAKSNARYYTKTRTNARYYTKTRSNARYYTKLQSNSRYQSATIPLGGTQSGLWTVAGTTGEYAVTEIEFDQGLPGAVTADWLGVGETTTACPGPGQAAPGKLCVYSSWTYSIVFHAFINGTNSESEVDPLGSILYLRATSPEGNARGSWTVRAPLTPVPFAAAPRTPRERSGSSSMGLPVR